MRVHVIIIIQFCGYLYIHLVHGTAPDVWVCIAQLAMHACIHSPSDAQIIYIILTYILQFCMHRSFLKTVSCIQCHHKVFGSKRLKTTPSIHLYSLDIYIWRVLRTYTHSHHKITHSSSLASRRCRSLLL